MTASWHSVGIASRENIPSATLLTPPATEHGDTGPQVKLLSELVLEHTVLEVCG